MRILITGFGIVVINFLPGVLLNAHPIFFTLNGTFHTGPAEAARTSRRDAGYHPAMLV